MSAIHIRPAAPDEYDAIDALVSTSYAYDYGHRDHINDDVHTARARAARFEVWVAVDEAGDLLGSITTTRDRGEPLMEDATDDELSFRLLAVLPKARRRGIGAALTRHAIDLATDRGYRRVFLKSAPNMTGAHALYDSLGSQRDDKRDGLVIDGVKAIDLFAFVIDVDDVPATANTSRQEQRA